MPRTATAIHQILAPERVRVGLPGTDKEVVVNALLDLLEGHEAVGDLDRVREAVWSREGELSTGVGKGLGLPHAKTSAATGTVAAFAITEAPVDFSAIDGEPVHLVFLLVGTEAAKSEHIRILSRISRLVSRQGLRESLMEAETPEDVLDAFAEAERNLVR
jgi:PTS system fructose-specific IIA component